MTTSKSINKILGGLKKKARAFGIKTNAKASSSKKNESAWFPKGTVIFEEDTKIEGQVAKDYWTGDPSVKIKVKGKIITIENPDVTEVHISPAKQDKGERTRQQLINERKGKTQ